MTDSMLFAVKLSFSDSSRIKVRSKMTLIPCALNLAACRLGCVP
jgi:hypothetical protein